MYKRIFTIVIDSVGCGALPDASRFGDAGTNTLAHTANANKGLKLPVLEDLGLGVITDIEGVKKTSPKGYVTKMAELSNGKDTMTGHWEMMGIETKSPFITFTDTGFPKELMDELEKKTGHKFIGNYAASGTEIIKELGERQLETKELIIYTSADSVLQIAANEEIIPLEELYRVCQIAREITMKKEWLLGRVIARPFVGTSKENFKRTTNRHDYAVKPPKKTVLNYLQEAGYQTISVGKIKDIFDSYGISEGNKITSTKNGMEITMEIAKKDFTGLCFVNLVDFDALYGHRRDPKGYGMALEEFDGLLGQLMEQLNDDDLLIVTADHGNDPTHTGSDHTREYVPLVVWNKKLKGGILDVRRTFADLGATIAENFKVAQTEIGESFLKELK